MFTIDNIVLDLLGFSGTGGAASSYSVATETNGAAHLGPTWNDFLAAGQTVSFNGFAVEFDVQSIALSPHLYSNTFLFYGGDNVTVSTAAEPGTLALFGLGFATLAAARRRRRH